jgi:hypothetical protein
LQQLAKLAQPALLPIPEARRSWNYSENKSLFSFAPCHVMDSAYFVM